MAFSMYSASFESGARIPDKYARDGANVSPPIEWLGAPPDTKSFAVVIEDPDAPRGMFRHWAAYDVGPGESGLREGAGKADTQPRFKTAVNDFGNRYYDGPQPPPGHGTHHYHIRCLALDVEHLNLPDSASVADVVESAHAHMLAETEIVGTFSR
jgi:Raf kinase inhibitor-like YbhB/YbcL family protein